MESVWKGKAMGEDRKEGRRNSKAGFGFANGKFDLAPTRREARDSRWELTAYVAPFYLLRRVRNICCAKEMQIYTVCVL